MCVFKFFLGAIIGLFLALMLVSVIAVLDVKFDVAIVTNIVIAAATCVATYIHIDSVGRQRRLRVWDVNKAVLLDLLDTLSKTISQIEGVINSIYSEDKRVEDVKLYLKLEAQINHAVNVYSVLMGASLTAKLELYRAELKRIESDFEEDCLDVVDAYTDQLALSRVLYNQLKMFVAKVADVEVV